MSITALKLEVPYSADEFSFDGASFARLAAESGHSVLITGETGSGKTHLARLIHASGPRARGPFVRVNCAAIPDSLFEREMFGHVRGAYTDAREPAAGFLEAAHGGTLFLDEVSELAPHNQPKLLTVLEEGRYRKLGSMREERVDVQVLAAANRDLDEMVRLKQFREDLLYRLAVLRVTVPPLRERRGEIPELVDSILERIARPGAPPTEVSGEAMALLCACDWPGNIRQLENTLRAAAVFSGGGPVRPQHLPVEVRHPPAVREGKVVMVRVRRAERYAAPDDPSREKEMIRDALELAGGNRSRAAQRLGMSRSTLWAKLQRYGLAPAAAPALPLAAAAAGD